MDDHRPNPSPDEFFFGALPLGYVAVRKDGVITQANRAAADLLDYDRTDLVGRIAAEFPFDDANRRLFLDQMSQRARGVAGCYALQLRSHGNRAVPVACFAVPHFDVQGQYWGSRGIVVPYEQMHHLAVQSQETNLEVFQRVVPFEGNGAAVEAPAGTLTGTWSSAGAENPTLAALLPKLTKRERDVVSLLLMGLRVNGVAERLHLSHYTVRNHLKRIFRKAGVNSQGQLLLKLNSLQ